MEELKTLKDIDKLVMNTSFENWNRLEKTNEDNYVVLEREATKNVKKLLKKEAIKWIKRIQKIKDNGEELFLDEGCIWCIEDVGTSSAIVIVKHVFDIKEEDLNEE